MVTEQQSGLSQDEIVRALHALGLCPGAVVLVHSSLSSLGRVEGGAASVVEALLEAVSPGGTVLVPTLTVTPRDGPEHPPVFNPRISPCWTGAIPETFRRRPDARRSAHPTHSVAGIGPGAAGLLARHEYCPTPCAADSPYGRLADTQGFVLLLGVTHECNTCLHMVEELAGAPYHLQDRSTLAHVVRDDETWDEIPTLLHLWTWERNFAKIEPLLREAHVQRDGVVGRAHSRLIDASGMCDVLLPLLRRDPLFLLSDAARVRYQQSVH